MNQNHKDWFKDVGLAIWDTFKEHSIKFFVEGLILAPLSMTINKTVVSPYKGAAKLFTARAISKISPDGAVLEGPAEIGYAKFAIRKGLPEEGQKRMAVENEPHRVDDFNGIIKEGYGKGTKKLLWAGNAVIKIKNKTHIGRVNIHEHTADKAGLHYDIVAEGISPGTEQFEIKIYNGPYQGRYAFVRPDGFGPGQVLINRMKDRGIVLPKPKFNLKNEEFLKELDINPGESPVVEWKPDGSLANVLIRDNQAIFRSHRETGETYYDRLPALEDVGSHSPLITSRFLFPGPNQDGTILKGELFHPEGASRVAGILNSSADKSIEYQLKHGPVVFYTWDIVKLRGKDVSHLPYGERRAILESVTSSIHRFNRYWHVVPRARGNFFKFYSDIIADKRGLPYSEGVVIKRSDSSSGDPWYKVKFRDTVDVRVVELIEGAGKRKGSVGRMVVETKEGGRGEVGSFQTTDEQLRWMWQHRDMLKGQTAEIYAQEITKAGVPRAGVFYRWHPGKSEAALLMYSLDDLNRLYAIKSSGGWRKK